MFHPAHSPLRQGSYRALAATANHFARESHMDELAHALEDGSARVPTEEPEEREAAGGVRGGGETIRLGQEQELPGRDLAWVAGTRSWATSPRSPKSMWIANRATCKVVRVVSAFECGAIVNPDNLRNQIEGSNVQGLGGALFEAIEFENGKILNGRLSQYRVPRFSDLPALETVLLDRKDIPSVGAGECPMIGLAPAIANAIFDATGTRLRALPLVPNGLKAVSLDRKVYATRFPSVTVSNSSTGVTMSEFLPDQSTRVSREIGRRSCSGACVCPTPRFSYSQNPWRE